MVNSTRNKGNRTVTKSVDYLTGLGYAVDKVEKSGKFVKVKDLFGLYDLVAVHPDLGVLFVQVKTNTPARIKPLQLFSKCYRINGMCMTWYDKPGKKRGWVLHEYLPNGECVRFDNRK